MNDSKASAFTAPSIVIEHRTPRQSRAAISVVVCQWPCGTRATRLDLLTTCRRHGIEHGFAAADKKRLQNSFINQGDGETFTDEQRAYAAADATAASRLYVPQVLAATMSGTLNHLMTVEMGWIAVNAGMAWKGVRIDADARARLYDSCAGKLASLVAELKALGLENHRSNKQCQEYFKNQGLLELFCRGSRYSFAKDRIKDLKHVHPAIKLLHEIRKVEWLSHEAVLDPSLVSAVDGRVHPQHRHLGAASGRQSTSLPNVLSFDRTTKPLVIPEDGHGIGEVDLSQIEVGVAAACYGDPHLIDMFNAGDVYTAMAQRFYADKLTPAERVMDGPAFKRAHADLRDVMKTCTLGIIYGLTPHGLAARLSVPVRRADRILNEFMAMFSNLQAGLEAAWRQGRRRGYAVTATGLRRYVKIGVPVSDRDKNWMRNHPVQGSAAAAFKVAGIRLSKLYPQYCASLILAVHDAFVFEAPLDVISEVAALTRTVMCDTVHELFPALRPRAEINISCTRCWNKDGDGQALDRWLAGA